MSANDEESEYSSSGAVDQPPRVKVYSERSRQLYEIPADAVYPPTDPSIRPPSAAYDVPVEVSLHLEDAVVNYTIHKGLLEYYSPYFKTAFAERWLGTNAYTATIKEHDEATVNLWVCWLYTGVVNEGRSMESANDDIATLLKLWTFGEQYDFPAMRNACTDEIRLQFKTFSVSPYGHLAFLSEHTGSGSSLRNLMLDIAVASSHTAPASGLEVVDSGLGFELVQRLVAVKHVVGVQLVNSRLDAGCIYHTRSANGACCARPVGAFAAAQPPVPSGLFRPSPSPASSASGSSVSLFRPV